MKGELRCKLCGRLLGKTAEWEGAVSIKCHRCGTITEFVHETVRCVVYTEEGDELGLLTLKNDKI